MKKLSINDIFTKVGGRMKREYAKLFSFILGITFILSGVIFAVTRSYKDDKQAKIDEENKIIDEML